MFTETLDCLSMNLLRRRSFFSTLDNLSELGRWNRFANLVFSPLSSSSFWKGEINL